MQQSTSLPLRNISITDAFFSGHIKQMREKMLPYQWEIINDRVENAEKSYCIHNFEIAAGKKQGQFGGMVFQDTDLAKWMEAVAYSLETHPDADLEKTADACIELLEKAQWEDGYLNTYYTLVEPNNRWTNLLECHELYTAGHFIEAAVAYYNATGKRRLLDSMCRFADHICARFGPDEGQIKGYPGHQEIELALVKLYRSTGQKRYLDLAAFFINQRGTKPYYFYEEMEKRGGKSHFDSDMMRDPTYAQYHLPVRRQTTAEGHAVRAMYMYCAMADLAAVLPDASLLQACRVLFENIAEKKMYITAGIGSAAFGERFTAAYDLPNDTCYCETCASIGLALFALRMANLTGEGRYADVMERALYNTVLAGVSQSFTEFFYVNPLECTPKIIAQNPGLQHVKPMRQAWFGVACCPTNIARTLASFGQYICAENDASVTLHLFVSAHIMAQGVTLAVDSDYLQTGEVRITTVCETPKQLRIRSPQQAPLVQAAVNGAQQSISVQNGYFTLALAKGTTSLVLQFDMQAHFYYCNTQVGANAGRVAVVRGPHVYCAEECDNGAQLSALVIDTTRPPAVLPTPALPGVAPALQLQGWREESTENALYGTIPPRRTPVRIALVPYYNWNNRGEGEMRVWLRANGSERGRYEHRDYRQPNCL